MTEEIIEFYRKELTFYSLITKKRGFWPTTLIYVLLILTVLLVSLFIWQQHIMYLVGAATSFLLGLLFIVVFNNSTIKRLYRRFYISTFKCDKRGFHKEMVLKLREKLKSMNLDEDKTAKIQAMINNKAEKEKVPSIVFVSAIAALFIPLWSAYLTQLMAQFTQLKQLNSLFFILLVLVTEIAWLMVYLSDIRDNFITRYMVLNRLNDMISESMLLEDPHD